MSCGGGRSRSGAALAFPLERTWHLVGRAGEDLTPTAALFSAGLAVPGEAHSAGRFQLRSPVGLLAATMPVT
ncbi:MAG: hypothetical protein ACRDZ4_11380 [Egibacteraceae bacterium]